MPNFCGHIGFVTNTLVLISHSMLSEIDVVMIFVGLIARYAVFSPSILKPCWPSKPSVQIFA